MPLLSRSRHLSVAALVLAASCARTAPIPTLAPARLPFHADTVRTTQLAPGLLHHFVYSSEGPWAVNLLEVNRSSCWSARAVKGGSTAMGRVTTSAALTELARSTPVFAGVNADFFSLATGVPVSMHVEEGRLVTGPGPRPFVAFDSAGRPTIGHMAMTGSVGVRSGVSLRLTAWNRLAPDAFAVLDRFYGTMSDTGALRVELGLAGPAPYRVAFVDTLSAASRIPADGLLLVAGPGAPAAVRKALASARVGDTMSVTYALTQPRPRNAVGGWPIILRDGVITGAADSAGAAFAPVRHPRTAIGLADGGETLLIVVVDGRQKPYSDGMTLRELARLFQSLGARDAMNLDGGGSSAFVTAERDSTRTLRVRNRPSDAGGERTVGNALAIVRGC